MKKLFVLLTVLFGIGINTYAATGDVAGKIYSTDIKAYINGVEVPSYSIGGKTVVIIEDITTQCEYSDEERKLMFWELSPDYLNSGSNSYSRVPGTVVGNIYETDIKTYVRGKEIPCYSLNGKMAVAIEDLGDDNTLSDIGGKFIWNPDDRTISLEFIYSNTSGLYEIMKEKHLNMILSGKDGELNVEFESNPIRYGTISGAGFKDSTGARKLIYQGETIGYMYKYDNMAYYHYIYTDKLALMLEDVEPANPTYDDWMTYSESQWCDVISEFETDEYHFLYMRQPNFHGSTQLMKKVNKKDGTLVDYGAQFESVSLHGQKYFDNVTIDEENEKVYFGYDKNYVIDLKTDEIKVVDGN